MGTSHPVTAPLPGVLATIGNTPLVRLDRLALTPLHELYAKVEGFNPGGSSKDRSAMAMIAGAMQRGELAVGGTVVESSSGNMGVGLAQICSRLGLHFICVTDERATSTHLRLMQLQGAEVEVVTLGGNSARSLLEQRLRRVQELLRIVPNSYWPNQYANADNPAAHEITMHEIVQALTYPPDLIICSVSTCGTLVGCARYIDEQGLPTRIIAVDSVASSIFAKPSGTRLLPGMGAAVIPPLMKEPNRYDLVRVSDAQCVAGCRTVLLKEALLVGGSSGAVTAAYMERGQSLSGRLTCVLLFPDRGERYLDTIFSDEWARRNGLLQEDGERSAVATP
ncbi:2,3-diaminopropionate biosynthesis protein SbnA [Aquabacterium sp. CECT 9606]|uniref:2,3-diaminopropionate biosynthesis protein SbnA n=1 Tax=Aquabacterium sp. CECT 9606 TaxID=2845822 RepID=UPI001E359915|nr:2,3-diaminopropionate biosynthesis protein SbnA [Aquabacterium sp. CECT 9606]CAH0353129.1 N-(2-amino-2-carboxyethyl)-L-glutamate synthase [Aquabacterium sp. CECT 9606]